MWNLNFEDIDKFHISLGAGLLLGAFLLFLFNSWQIYDETSSLRYEWYSENHRFLQEETEKELIDLFKKDFDTKLGSLRDLANRIGIMIIVLTSAGGALFLMGYYRYLMRYVKKPKRRKKH